MSCLARPLARALPLALLAASTLAACKPPPPSAAPADPPPSSDVAIGREQDPQQMLAAQSEAFLAGFFARSPVWATIAGEHAHDGRWPNLSAEGQRERAAWVEEQLDKLAAIPREALDPDGRLELDVIRDQLEFDRFSAEVERGWSSDPLAYSQLISTGLDDLISRDFAPIDERAASVAARLEGLPTLIEQAIANLSDPTAIRRPHAEVGLAQLEGLRVLITEEVPARVAEADPALRERIAAASEPALAAIDALCAHVTAALPKAQGQWRLGPEAFATKLALTLQTDIGAEELVRVAHEEHERVRREMHALARELYAGMYGERALARAPEGDALVREVLDVLAADHPSPEQLRDAAEANLARLQAFVIDRALVPIDEQEVLEVIWTPPHAQGVAIAGLAAPAPLDADKPGLPSFYLVQPLPAAWDAATTESFLREYNSFMLEILSIHEAIPGHFVQLYWGKREPSKVRRVFANGPFVEGWAVYTERLMVEAGYPGTGPEPGAERPRGVSKALWAVQTDDALRAKAIGLHGLKFYLRTVANAILDHEIHAGSMTREEALALMVEGSFQERGEAEAKWVRAQLTSTQLSTYFVGATAWFRLREQAEARGDFELLRFHQQALGHGAPPVHRLPQLMGWE
ncbi:DUF885 domain-containing protein [Pseudenhygromyxa sp. WMMC2535]|uniref:DUF885 domain-containing protein n=1 Tax=Pseudenhygromyxa sp. WMMC2535 TaxID=2712867 RepID=UPI0015564CB3|nr:DUF885 domain-containing protein [Pseudenhygromyxa sp. WMMC2535]NVB40883.1 DUF885 domain-containing protein [Pseudenhygromyxa sp. WMMC2535]